MSRILVVDDEQSVLSIISTLLNSSGYEVTPALGGEVAAALLTDDEFDLMISDIRMSDVDGMQLLEMAHETRPDMAVIMLTAYGDVDTAVEAMGLGAFDYVKKPFEADKLLDTVRRALEFHDYASE